MIFKYLKNKYIVTNHNRYTHNKLTNYVVINDDGEFETQITKKEILRVSIIEMINNPKTVKFIKNDLPILMMIGFMIFLIIIGNT